MSRPQVGIERLPAAVNRRMSNNEPRESMNCKSCRKRKVIASFKLQQHFMLILFRSNAIDCDRPAKRARFFNVLVYMVGKVYLKGGASSGLTYLDRCGSKKARSKDGRIGGTSEKSRWSRKTFEG
jgi:hypothetical protein